MHVDPTLDLRMQLLQKFLAGSAILAACLPMTGCQSVSRAWDAASNWTPSILRPYRPDVHQGNLVTSEMISQLEKGMSAEQVQFLLGIPLLRDRFHNDRWDYIYYLNRRNGDTETRKLTVFFDGSGRVEKWETDPLPDETTADLLILGDKATVEREKAKAKEQSQAKAADAKEEQK